MRRNAIAIPIKMSIGKNRSGITGCSHLHCATRKEFVAAIDSGLDFESVEFDGRTLRVRCDKEAIILLLSRRGVLVELWTGRELVYSVPDADRSKDVFLRVTAMDKASGEKLFTQPFMLD